MPPGYTPHMSPAQLKAYQMAQYLQNMNKPLSYQEFLQQRGGGQTSAQQGSDQLNFDDVIKSVAEKKAKDYAESLVMGGGEAAAGAEAVGGMSTMAGAAPAMDVATMQAISTGAPMQSMMPAAGFSGSASTGAAAGEAAGAFDLAGIGSAGNAFLPIGGAVGMYDLWKNKRGGARGIGQGAASGAMMGSYFGPVGAGVGAVAGGLYGATMHESTRDVAKRHTQDLADKFTDDPTYQAYVRGIRGQYDSAPPDPEHPYAGEYKTFDEYKKAGLQADDLTGVMGNIETFGQDWTKLNFDQQKAITQGLIDAGLYNSKKGEVLVTDQNKAREIYDSVSKGGFKAPVVATKTAAGVPTVLIPRSKTRSPGIGMDGRPMHY